MSESEGHGRRRRRRGREAEGYAHVEPGGEEEVERPEMYGGSEDIPLTRGDFTQHFGGKAPPGGQTFTMLDERLKELEYRFRVMQEHPPAPPAPWYVNLIQGVTIVSIIGFAFWLGQMSGKINETSAKLDRLYGLTLESRDAIAPRLSAIEAKLDAIDKKLDAQRRPDITD